MPAFGGRVVAEKRDRVYDTVEKFLARHPEVKAPHPALGLRAYAISRTPFVVLYDFDEHELRVHFVVHRRASLKDLDPTAVDW